MYGDIFSTALLIIAVIFSTIDNVLVIIFPMSKSSAIIAPIPRPVLNTFLNTSFIFFAMFLICVQLTLKLNFASKSLPVKSLYHVLKSFLICSFNSSHAFLVFSLYKLACSSASLPNFSA